MPLEMNVEQHHRLQYSNSVEMVTQQLRNPLVGAVTQVMCKGEAQSVTDFLDAGEYAYAEDRSRRNPEIPVTGSRRWLVRPEKIESGQYIDEEDKFDTATDPTSSYVRVHTARVTRGEADRMLGIRKTNSGYAVTDGGILGRAREGKTPGAGTVLPTGQYVPHGSTGLTLDKLREAVKALKLADFGIDGAMDPLYCAITPNQEDDLLGIAAASGANLNTFNIEQLRSGKPTPLMGVNWILTNRLPLKANDGNPRLCPIWSKRNIFAGYWQAIKGDMWNDTSAKGLPYVYVSARLDCVRGEDKGVVVLECAE